MSDWGGKDWGDETPSPGQEEKGKPKKSKPGSATSTVLHGLSQQGLAAITGKTEENSED